MSILDYSNESANIVSTWFPCVAQNLGHGWPCFAATRLMQLALGQVPACKSAVSTTSVMTGSKWQAKLEGVSAVEASGMLTIHHFADPINETVSHAEPDFSTISSAPNADLHSDSVLHIDTYSGHHQFTGYFPQEVIRVSVSYSFFFSLYLSLSFLALLLFFYLLFPPVGISIHALFYKTIVCFADG